MGELVSEDVSARRVFWADLHNHSSAGVAKGSFQRSAEIARANLDVYAHTGQAQWPDLAAQANGTHEHWLAGYRRHHEQWPGITALMNELNEPGEFVAFSGYEWQSSREGDYVIIFPDDHAELGAHGCVAELAHWARAHGAILIPHHLGYPTGGRGVNWDAFPAEAAPLVEIFSEHGACERDEGPYPYIRHGLGPRMSGNTYQGALARGLHVGATAGTDTHVGFPGAYGQGLTAVLADRLDRASIMEALRARRTYAVTGDRIGLSFSLNGAEPGSILPAVDRRRVTVTARGLDRLARVEVLRNNQVVHRAALEDGERAESGPLRVRIEFGWGPWGDLGRARTCDWDIRLAVHGGRLDAVHPCFGGDPFDETRTSKIISSSDGSCHWISYTNRSAAFEERPNAMVVDVAGGDDARLTLDLYEPTRASYTMGLADLAKGHCAIPVGGFQSEFLYVHRPIPASEYALTTTFVDEAGRVARSLGTGEDVYYARVTQDNGQLAWSSPIWVATS